MIRQAIARALADVERFDVVGQASSGEEALELISRVVPDVALMDISMPGIGGLKAAQSVHALYPQVAVLILTVHDREDYLFKALQAGAAGYILKDSEMDELIEAVQKVARGETYISPGLMPKLVSDYLQRIRGGLGPTTPEGLTSREQQVLHLIAEGRTTNEIARDLTISPHTVRRHRDHIMNKLNLHSKAELIRFAVQEGLLDEPG